MLRVQAVQKNVVDEIDLQAEPEFYIQPPNSQQLVSAILILNYLVKQKITNVFPNLYTALKVIAAMRFSCVSRTQLF